MKQPRPFRKFLQAEDQVPLEAASRARNRR
jgi:hypothetical protein